MKPPAFMFVLGIPLLLGLPAWAQVNYDSVGGIYSQTFDSLATSGTSIPWVNGTTLPGWFLYRQPAPGTDVTSYAAGNGSSSTGGFYSFGGNGSDERALGGVGSGGTYFGSPTSGAVAGWIAVGLVNNTGQTLKQLAVTYDGEQWRNSGETSTQIMRFEYGWGTSFTTVGTWTAPGGTFDWSSPVVGGTAGPVDGNTTGRVTGRGGFLSAVSWMPGETLWLRWIEINDSGSDHGLAIDNFTFRAMVPEPASVGVWTGMALIVLAWLLRTAGSRAN